MVMLQECSCSCSDAGSTDAGAEMSRKMVVTVVVVNGACAVDLLVQFPLVD